MNTRIRRSVAVAAALAVALPAAIGTAATVSAQDGGKFCEGTDIVFFPGGSPGGPLSLIHI